MGRGKNQTSFLYPIEGFNIEKVEEILKEEGILDTEHFGVSVMANFGYSVVEAYPKTTFIFSSTMGLIFYIKEVMTR
ncbi:hypothetical protein [Clostridium manihotivorum]|uniref:hypothetical protein n=1 Tax=Clostridium manihotivorum TaxID=2320868 RepID=UPI0023AB3A03|nr:hypothetical protein [Clostridium manihotivorum]